MSFQVYFHNCNEQLQNEVNTVIEGFKLATYELKVKSSGSTGVPKEIIHPKKDIVQSAERTNKFFHLHENSVVLCPLAIHTIGAKMALFRAIIGDYKLHFVEASRDFTQDLPKELNFDLTSLAVIQFANLLQKDKNMISCLRDASILLGGSAIPEDVEQESVKRNINAYIGFGMTETLSHIALRKLGNEYYHCLDGITVQARNDGMEIHINNKTITSTDIIEENDNQSFKWIGRSDFIINSGGIKISPELLENAIVKSFDLTVVIVGIPDVTFGQKAILVTETAIDEQLKTRISELIETTFGKYHVPKDFITHAFSYINGLKLDRLGLMNSVKALYE